jgi:transaldolase
MKFFLDTASVKDIREGVALGLCDGVTTNPTLLQREGRPARVVREITKICDGPISAEVVSLDSGHGARGLSGGRSPRTSWSRSR